MEIEKALSKEETVTFLRQLADALESGQEIRIDDVAINLPTTLDISLEYEEEGDDSELEIEFNWTKSTRAKTGKFEIFQGKSGEWYIRLKASNGQIILMGEGYKTKQGAEKGIDSIKKNANIEQIEYRVSKAEQPYFVLKARNGEILGMSQMYKRMSSCEKGIRSVLRHAPDATVELLQ